MGERRLNFPEAERQTEGSPRFAPLSERSQYVDPVWIVISFGIVVAVAILAVAARALKRKVVKEFSHPRAGRVPEHVYGRDEEIRQRMERKKREERDSNGTWKLESGETLRLTVPRLLMTFPATVTQNEEDGFVAELPARADDTHQPVIGDHVRAFLLRGGMRWSFDSTVSMIYLTGTNGVRIAHTRNLRVTDRLVEAPVHLRVRVRYGVLQVNPDAKGPVLLSSVEEACTPTRIADLHTLTMHGCTLQTKTVEPMARGDWLRMRAHPLREEEEITVLTEIESVEAAPGDDGAGLLVEVRFLALDTLARLVLERTIHMHQKELMV